MVVPLNTPKWSFLVGKHHIRKPRYHLFIDTLWSINTNKSARTCPTQCPFQEGLINRDGTTRCGNGLWLWFVWFGMAPEGSISIWKVLALEWCVILLLHKPKFGFSQGRHSFYVSYLGFVHVLHFIHPTNINWALAKTSTGPVRSGTNKIGLRTISDSSDT